MNTLGSVNVRRTDSKTSGRLQRRPREHAGGHRGGFGLDQQFRRPDAQHHVRHHARQPGHQQRRQPGHLARRDRIHRVRRSACWVTSTCSTRSMSCSAARYDIIKVKNEEFAGTFNTSTGTSANPGAFRTTGSVAEETDEGPSYSASVTYKAPYNLRPYVTYAQEQRAARGQQQPHRQQRGERWRDRQGGAQGARHQDELLQQQAVRQRGEIRAEPPGGRARRRSQPADGRGVVHHQQRLRRRDPLARHQRIDARAVRTAGNHEVQPEYRRQRTARRPRHGLHGHRRRQRQRDLSRRSVSVRRTSLDRRFRTTCRNT